MLVLDRLLQLSALLQVILQQLKMLLMDVDIARRFACPIVLPRDGDPGDGAIEMEVLLLERQGL